MIANRIRKCSLKCKLISSATLAVALAAGIYLTMRADGAFAKTPLGKSWSQSKWISMNDIDHTGFDALLKKYVDSDGNVNYSGWKNSPADRRSLQDYLTQLGRAGTRIKASREAKLAFWINAYNAVTLEGILQVYPTKSIRNHTSKFGGYNIWKELPLRVGNANYSLEAIEHDILRKMNEPRIHFTIVCASIGCPRLRNEAYTSDLLDEQLADNTRDFFSRSKNFRVDRQSGVIFMSTILKWFGGDFGSSQIEQLAYLKPYLPESAQRLAGSRRTRVKYLKYDWSLNDRRSPVEQSRGRSRQSRRSRTSNRR